MERGTEASDEQDPDSPSFTGFRVEAHDHFFRPDLIKLRFKDGGEYFRVFNLGSQQHNITIPNSPVNQDIPPGQNLSIPNFYKSPGDYTFFCRFHPEQMKGVIRVS